VFAPVLLLFKHCKECKLDTLALTNSPFYHTVFVNCNGVTVTKVDIDSPTSSKNTDGISLYASKRVRVRDCTVATGDDNIVIKEGTSDVVVQDCVFTGGHGASIGSLGEGGSSGTVTDVVMKRLKFVGTDYAARVKTWQGGRGAVRNISFSDIKLEDVGTPVAINQVYCPHSQHPGECQRGTSAVHISDITVRRMTGSYKDKQPISLRCDPVAPCRRIVLDHVDLKPAHKASHNLTNLCENAFGTASNVNPPACLLREGGFSAMEATERAKAAESVANTLSLRRRKESR
jgi:galacturan 1,4-alpha-galacturonidase